MGRVTFLLAHLSDPHMGPLPPIRARDLAGKRLTGYLNWQRRSRIHDMNVLAHLVADVRSAHPDHIAVTGDVTNLGLAGEFDQAAAWLRALGDPRDVSFVPGNHDAYSRSSMAPLSRIFAPWACGDGQAVPSYPYLRVRGPVALIGVSSAVPTALFMASGRLGARQCEELARLLEETGARGLMRVVMIHHPPWREGATFGRTLVDAERFEAIIARHGAELILHGHNHRQSVHRLPSPKGLTPVLGVGSASAVPGTPRHRAAYHLIRIDKADDGWRLEVETRGLPAGGAVIAGQGRFEI